MSEPVHAADDAQYRELVAAARIPARIPGESTKLYVARLRAAGHNVLNDADGRGFHLNLAAD